MRQPETTFHRRMMWSLTARILGIWAISKLVWWSIPRLLWTDDAQLTILYPLIAGYLMGWSFQPFVRRVSGWRIVLTSTLATVLVVACDMIVANIWSLIATGHLEQWLGDLFGIMLLAGGIVGAFVLGAIGSAAGLAFAYLGPPAQEEANPATPPSTS